MKTLVKVVLIFAFMTLPLSLAYSKSLGERRIEPGGSPPVITNSFASQKASHGDVWRIYLEAHDPDADMQKIVAFIQQPGSGHSSRSVLVSKGDRARLFGTLACYISRPRSAISEWAELTLTIFVRDRGGNVSNSVVFPVAISRGVKQESPPPPFNTGGLKILGGIGIRLFFPFPDGG